MVRKILNIVTTVVLIALIALVVFVFISRVSGNTPTIFGYTLFRVQTDSMTPTLNVGDVILVKECKPEDVKLGDIVTYKVTSGSLAGQTITHRVAEEPVERDGVYYYRTKGDKDGAAMDEEISYEVLKGKYVRTIPFANKFYNFFLSPAGLITFIGVIIALFGYEMVSLIISYKSAEEKDDDYYAPPNRKPKKKRKK